MDSYNRIIRVFIKRMSEIKPNEIYTTRETQDFLKVSSSTIKRMLKGGIIKAYKVGGTYRIWGSEILKLISPEAESGVYKVYDRLRSKTRKTIEKW
jgi:excisionase family DNA binding protein